VHDKESPFPLSIQAAILLGCLVISFSILVGSGIIKLGNQISLGSNAQQAQASAAPGATPAPSVYQNVTAGSFPTQGDSNAKVLVVEWADFQCPFCEQFFSQVEPQIKKDYIDTGKIKFAFRDFAFLGQESNDAANAARCANDQGKFWDFHDYLYSHQGQENSGTFSKDNLKKFGAAVGLNTDQFNSCVDSNKHAQDVTDDTTAGKNVGVSGTPTVYINGVQLVGAQPYSAFKAEIDKALAAK
jgi:protein-disulfide isomerase